MPGGKAGTVRSRSRAQPFPAFPSLLSFPECRSLCAGLSVNLWPTRGALHHLLLDLGAGCAFQEPADERGPQAIDDVAPKRLPYPHHKKKEAEEPAGAGGD